MSYEENKIYIYIYISLSLKFIREVRNYHTHSTDLIFFIFISFPFTLLFSNESNTDLAGETILFFSIRNANKEYLGLSFIGTTMLSLHL